LRREEIGAETEKAMKHKSARIPVNHKSLLSAMTATIAVLLVSAASQASAQETVRGIVASANERNDTLSIQLRSDGKTGDFKVQDGLIFNSVQYGDPVEITIETIDGARTIIGLKKQ
jgi:hypothetical protein